MAPDVDPERVAAVARHATQGLSRAKTLALWRNVIARFPGEVSYAKQYVQELLLSEGWQELDTFAKAAKRYKSDALDLDYIDADLARLELRSAASRLELFERRHGLSLPLLFRSYELHSLLGDHGAANDVARRMRSLGAGRSLPGRLSRRAGFYARTYELWRRPSPGPRDYDVLVINLDGDRLRLERMEQQLVGVPHTRIPGVKGAYLPAYLLRAVSQNQGHLLKGTMGCFLSHIVAWERVVAAGRSALVLEDDACILAGLPPALAPLDLPSDFDVVFVNERMQPPDHGYFERRFFASSAADVALSKPADWGSAGTDGYLVSPKGAAKLLGLIELDGIAGDVDWRLVSYSLNRAERASIIKRGGLVGQSLEYHERFRSKRTRLRSYVMLPSLVRQFAGGSVRLWDNDLPHAHLAALVGLMTKRRQA